MPFLVKDIIERNLFDGAKLVAGFSGAENPISWINVMEILDATDSLQKGELLITTGYQLDKESLYSDVVERLYRRDVSGMAIQAGYYLTEIPKYILKSADQIGFPIILLPPSLTFSSLLHTLMEQLYVQPTRRTDDSLDTLYKMLDELVKNNADLFSTVANTYLFLLIPSPDDMAKGNIAQECILRVHSYLLAQAEKFEQLSLQNGKTVFCLTLPSKNTYQDVIFELTILLTFLSEQQHVNFYVGVDMLGTPGDLHSVFANTVSCCKLLEHIGAKRGVCAYQNVPFFELFDAIHRNNKSMLLGSGVLQKLLDYDRANKTAYVQTLRVYLAHQGNAVQTAERLFIHRHTLINRLQKIVDLCNLDLSDYYTRIYLSITLMLHDYFAL